MSTKAGFRFRRRRAKKEWCYGKLRGPELTCVWLELAESKLDHAKRIFKIGLYDDAVSRAYYAMFYAAKAALLSEGMDLRRHSSAVTKFREIFVVTGRVDAEYLRYLGRAQSARERSDYTPFAPLGKNGAEEILNIASAFVEKIKELV